MKSPRAGSAMAIDPFSRLAWGLWHKVFVEPFARTEAESQLWRQSPPGQAFDWRSVTILVMTVLSLTFIEYIGKRPQLEGLANGVALVAGESTASPWRAAFAADSKLYRLTWWAVSCVLAYLAAPALVVRYVFGQSLADYGLGVRGMFRDAWIYGLMFAGMVPCVLIAGANESFLHTYPFYRLEPDEPLWPQFWMWEALYILQFISLEFFFRGFVLHGLRLRLGCYAVFVMMVPYVMIHFGKPLLETLVAIIAGVALGALSLKNRSVWLGAAIHVAVAMSMDLLALWRAGRL